MKGRPIVGGPNSPTQVISGLLEKILTPIVSFLKTYVKDDWDFIRKLPSHVDYPCVLTSCGVVSVYTSIPHDLGLEALSYWIDKKRNLIPERFTKAFILDIYMLLQLVGTAMGMQFAPPYACVSVGYLKEAILFPRSLPLHFTLTECQLIEYLNISWTMVLFYGQKMLILIP